MRRHAFAGFLLLMLLALTGRAASAAPLLDFDSLAVFTDPSLESLDPFVFSPSAVLDETTLGAFVGFAVPGDVPAGSIATSGDRGVVNLFDPILHVLLQQPVSGLELSLTSLRGEALVVEVFDALDQRIAQWVGLPTPGASGFPQERVRLDAPGIVGLRVSAGPQATSFFLDDLAVVPEPAASLLAWLGLAAIAFRSRRFTGAPRWLVLAAPLLLSCFLSPVTITSPSEGELIFAPDVQVDVSFSPALQAGETVEATLARGLDAADVSPQLVDLTADLQLAADGATAVLPVGGLPPGRNTISIKRFAASGGTAVGFDTVTVDRGGFFPDAIGPFEAGVQLDQIAFTSPLGNARVLDLTVWYPTDSTAAPDAALGGVPGAPVAPGLAELPVLLFSHGSCGIPTQTLFLTADLARLGFVVVGMTHPPNVSGPTCADPTNLITSFLERPTDVSRSLDWLLAESADPLSPLHGLADVDRIGVAGHSFGGMTAIRVPALDARFRASLPLAPEYDSVANFIDPQLPLAVPIMIQGGEVDTTTPFLTDQMPVFDKSAAPRFLVEILGAGHAAFSNFCPALPSCPDALVTTYGFGFLGRYVAADRRWASLIEPLAGAVLTADP